MFFEQLINGLQIGLTYLLIAMGYNLIFGVLKIVNLAYGEVVMVAAFSGLLFSQHVSKNAFLIVLAALVGAVASGLLIHFIAVRPLGNVSDINSPRHLAVVVSTIGMSLVLQNGALEMFGGYSQRFPQLFPGGQFYLFGSSISTNLVVTFIASILMATLFFILVYRTSLGLRLRALSDNLELAMCIGIRVPTDRLTAIIVSSVLAGCAALLICQAIGTASPFIGTYYGLKGLIIVIVGGLGRTIPAVWLAIFLGVAETFTSAYVSSSYRDAITFAMLLAFIVLRPSALRLSAQRQ